MSSEKWIDERDERAGAVGRPEFRMVSGTGESFTYVGDECFMTHDAATAVQADHDPHFTRLRQDDVALEEHGLRLYRWEDPAGPPLPDKVAQLRAEARSADPVGDVDVALHYVFSGEKAPGQDKTTIPRGVPAAPPAPAAAVEVPLLGEGRPGIAIVDTGIDLGSTTGQTGMVIAEEDDDLDIDLLLAPVAPGEPPTLGAEAGHGTFITWLVARMTEGTVAVADLGALDPDGLGSERKLVRALQRLRLEFPSKFGYAPGTTVPVINLSLGGFTDDGERTPPIDKDALPLLLGRELAAWEQQFPETVFVAAAGNDGQTGRAFWPAAAAASNPQVIAVGSLDAQGAPSVFTNRGDWVTVSTIGENIHSDYPTGDYNLGEGRAVHLSGGATWSGTSFATPIVAAEIARRARALGISGREAWESLLQDLGTDPRIPGRGLVWVPSIDPTA